MVYFREIRTSSSPYPKHHPFPPKRERKKPTNKRTTHPLPIKKKLLKFSTESWWIFIPVLTKLLKGSVHYMHMVKSLHKALSITMTPSQPAHEIITMELITLGTKNRSVSGTERVIFSDESL